MVSRRPSGAEEGSLAPDAARTELVTWRDPLLWLTIALTIFAVGPFLLPGYFWGANDARHHVYFLFEYDRVVADGIWWPRWSPDFAFGYGYPFFNIYGPLSHFVAELLLRYAGFSYTGAVEAVFGLSIIGSAVAMYLFVRDLYGRQAGMVSALVYVYVPYHLLNLYVRANLAESMAFVWMPLCLWGVRQAIVRPHAKWLLAAAASYAGLMLTSNLVFVLFTPLLGVYLITLAFAYGRPATQLWRQSRLGYVRRWMGQIVLPVAGLVAGIGISTVFWLPMLLERQYVRVDQWFDGRYDFHGQFVYWYQLFSPQWGFGTSLVGPDDSMGFQLGVVPVCLAVVGLLLVWHQAGRAQWELACFVGGALVTAFLALQWAAPLWDMPIIGSVLGFAQFPWRWLSITVLCISPVAGLVVHPIVVADRTRLSLPTVVVVMLVLVGSYPYLEVEIVEPAEGPVGLPALMRFQKSSDEMTGSTVWVKEIPTWSSIADGYISQEKLGADVAPVASLVDYTVLDYNRETGFVVNSERHTSVMEEVWYWSPLEGRRIVFNHFFYPGWNAYLLDGRHGDIVRPLTIIPEAEGTLGRMTVPVPVGEGYVLLRFEDTMPRKVGRAISLASIAILAIGGLLGTIRSRRSVFVRNADKKSKTT